MRTEVADSSDTLQGWMERNGVNGEQLRVLLRERGKNISKGHLSGVLKGSARCSAVLAMTLRDITGVSIDTLLEWPRRRPARLDRIIQALDQGNPPESDRYKRNVG